MWHTPTIPALERLTQVNYHQAETSIGYSESLRLNQKTLHLLKVLVTGGLPCNSHTGMLWNESQVQTQASPGRQKGRKEPYPS